MSTHSLPMEVFNLNQSEIEEEKEENELKEVKEGKKHLILKAAQKVFAEKGFNGAKTAEIAKEAGVAEGTIYRYFNTKKDLLLELSQLLVLSPLGDMLQELKGKSNETILKAIIKNRINLVKENVSLVKIVLIEGQYHPELRKLFSEGIILKAMRMMERFIKEQIDAEIFRQDINPQVAFRTLAGSVFGLIAWQGLFLNGEPDILSEDEFIDQILQIFLFGMNKR